MTSRRLCFEVTDPSAPYTAVKISHLSDVPVGSFFILKDVASSAAPGPGWTGSAQGLLTGVEAIDGAYEDGTVVNLMCKLGDDLPGEHGPVVRAQVEEVLIKEIAKEEVEYFIRHSVLPPGTPDADVRRRHYGEDEVFFVRTTSPDLSSWSL